eukprot:m.205881 g.205881  ORF g.205881 m.205881 type:complete len:636 (-) comp18492_c1_seq6:1159-3066(-)
MLMASGQHDLHLHSHHTHHHAHHSLHLRRSPSPIVAMYAKGAGRKQEPSSSTGMRPPSPKDSLYHHLGEMWIHSELVDCTVGAKDGTKFSAHRVVLAAQSDFFRALFRSGAWKEQREGCTTLDTDADTLQGVLTYLYFGTLDITCQNVQDVLMLASLLGVSRLVDLCETFMVGHVDGDNALGLRALARHFDMAQLLKRASDFVRAKFVAVSQSEEFAQLNPTAARDLLASDTLVLSSEADVLHASLRWVKGYFSRLKAPPTEQNLDDIRTVWAAVRLPLVPLPLLVKAAEEHVLVQTRLSEQLVALIAELRRGSAAARSLVSSTPSRRGDIRHAIIAMGGFSHERGRLAIVEAFDCHLGRWTPLRSMSMPRSYLTATATHQGLLAIGGYVGGTVESHELTLSTCELFDPLRREWIVVGSLPGPRARCCAVANEAHVYVVGGVDGLERTIADVVRADTTVLSGDEPELTWEPVTAMDQPRSQHGAAILSEHLYVIGGKNGTSELLDTVQRLDLSTGTTGTWEAVASLPFCCASLAVTVCDGKLYVAGGVCSSGRASRRVVCYDPNADVWQELSPMLQPRKQLALVNHLGNLFAVGGANDSQVLSSAERFDPELNDWTPISGMTFGRRGLAACTLAC